jgi:hypothetical protein
MAGSTLVPVMITCSFFRLVIDERKVAESKQRQSCNAFTMRLCRLVFTYARPGHVFSWTGCLLFVKNHHRVGRAASALAVTVHG